MSSGFWCFTKNSKKHTEDTATAADTGAAACAANKTLIVKINKCPQNHHCPSIKVCPVGALTQQGFSAPTVDMQTCIRCGKCVRFCPRRALALE